MSAIRLRPAIAGDRPAIIARIEADRLLLEGIPSDFRGDWIVAETDGELIGSAGVEVHGGHGLLRSVAVRADRRGEGLGRRLVEDRVVWARGQGLATLSLVTLDAGSFFAAHGFHRVERAALPKPLHGTVELEHARCAEADGWTMELLPDVPRSPLVR